MAPVLPRRLGSMAVVLAATLACLDAGADVATPPPDPNAWQKAPPTRRGGFAMGMALGFGVAGISGYPADVKKAGYAAYYATTDARPAPNLSVWVGGALSDWLNFGFGVTGGLLLATGDNTTQSFAGMFHIEAFPLFYVSDKLRDLGLMFDAGSGIARLIDPKDRKLVDSTAASMVGGGVFWEPIQFWRIRGGPFLVGNYMWSGTAQRPAVYAGWRMSLYSSKP